MVLVVIRPYDDPAQVLLALRHAELTGGKAMLVQLSPEISNDVGLEGSPQPGPRLMDASDIPRAIDSGRALMWAEIERRAFIIKGISLDEIPSIVKSFTIDRVIVAANRAVEKLRRSTVEHRLISMLSVPLWILGRGMPLNLGEPNRTRRILLPISFAPEMESDLRFACELAKSHGAALSVLHVFAHSPVESSAGERSPLAVKSRLPLASLRAANVAWPIEVVIRQGDPATQIVEFNRQRPHDLIILRPSTDVRQGSLSCSSLVGRVCSEIPCPVAILCKSMEGLRENSSVIDIAAHRTRIKRRPIPIAAVEG